MPPLPAVVLFSSNFTRLPCERLGEIDDGTAHCL
jgi:hypothetical protein